MTRGLWQRWHFIIRVVNHWFTLSNLYAELSCSVQLTPGKTECSISKNKAFSSQYVHTLLHTSPPQGLSAPFPLGYIADFQTISISTAEVPEGFTVLDVTKWSLCLEEAEGKTLTTKQLVLPLVSFLQVWGKREILKAKGLESKHDQGDGKWIIYDRREPLPSPVLISSSCIKPAIQLQLIRSHWMRQPMSRTGCKCMAKSNWSQEQGTHKSWDHCLHEPSKWSQYHFWSRQSRYKEGVWRWKKLMHKYSAHSWSHYHVLRHKALMKMYRLNLMDL